MQLIYFLVWSFRGSILRLVVGVKGGSLLNVSKESCGHEIRFSKTLRGLSEEVLCLYTTADDFLIASQYKKFEYSVPVLTNPVMISDDKFLCCCCCKSGPITCALSLPATGIAPGQEIPFSLEVENYSNSTVASIYLSLIKNMSFTVTRPKKETVTESKKVVQMVLNGVASNDKYSWTERVEVPSLPPSYLKHCSIIDIAYNLEVEIKISGLHKNMFIHVPIVIGTVPLVTQASNSSGGRPEQFIPAAAGASAPPAYEDCMFGAVNIQDEGEAENIQGNLKFVPRYPVYRNQMPC